MVSPRPDSTLSVVIPALNEEACISAAIASALAAGADEVIVADGGSADSTRETARAAGACVIAAERGRGVQLRAGAAAASGDILLFLHADAVLPSVAKQEIIDLLNAGDAGYFRLCFTDRSWSVRLVAWAANLRASLFSLPYGDQALFIRRSRYEALGGFRSCPFLEDLDFVLRARRTGSLRGLPHPVTVSARRLRKPFPLAPIAVSLRNVAIALLFLAGVPPERLIKRYR